MRNSHKILGRAIVLMLPLAAAIAAQQKKIPYIEYYDCPKCEHLVVEAPTPTYPNLGGTGASTYNGLMAVLVTVNERGVVERAVAVSGHPLFRRSIEEAAMKAKFRPRVEAGTPLKHTVALEYQVVSSANQEILPKRPPIVNALTRHMVIPEPSDAAKRACASGYVEIRVVIDESGTVSDAQVLSGNKLLWPSAIEAAKKTQFTNHGHAPPRKLKGRLRYNFPSPRGCPVA